MKLMAMTTALLLLPIILLLLSQSMAMQTLALFLLTLLLSTFLGKYLSTILGTMVMITYASGLLVLIAYFVSLCNNQKIITNPLAIILWLSVSTSIYFTNPLSPYTHVTLFTHQQSHIMLLNPSNANILLFLVSMLLISMICVIKILSTSSGPLRPWNK